MQPSSRARALRSLAGAFMVLLGCVLSAPATARAGCGHDVLTESRRASMALLDDLSLLETVSEDALPRRKLPCSGPSCSGRPAVPPVSAMVHPVRVELWCSTSKSRHSPGQKPVDAVIDAPPIHPLHASDPIDRPPRARSSRESRA